MPTPSSRTPVGSIELRFYIALDLFHLCRVFVCILYLTNTIEVLVSIPFFKHMRTFSASLSLRWLHAHHALVTAHGFERSGFFWLIVHCRVNANACSLLLFMINISFITQDTGIQ